MRRRDYLAVAAAVASLAMAALLAFLAVDAYRWQDAVRTGDLQFRVAPRGPDPWESPDRLPFRPAARLVGVDDDLAFRRAVLRYGVTVTELGGLYQQGGPPVEAAQRLLKDVVRSDESAARRSRAANFLAVLTYQNLGYLNAAYVRQAADEFRRAIRLDPANEEPKFNLELVLYAIFGGSGEGGGGTGAGGRSRLDVGGAAATPPGRGY